MPTYQYVCEACKDEFEVVQSFSDATLTEHDPGCGGHVRKRFNAVGVVFKGSGFYRNDSRGAEAPAGGAGDAAPASTDAPSTPAKTETQTPAPAGPANTPSKTGAPSKPSTPSGGTSAPAAPAKSSAA